MPHVIVYEAGGVGHVLDAPSGLSVMEVAVRNGVAGIDADCGGSCACATCHVHVDPAWTERTGSPSEMESDLLEFADGVNERSRLSCQIVVDDRLDGLIVHVPGV
jgi:2Fe-2S ferredoxin